MRRFPAIFVLAALAAGLPAHAAEDGPKKQKAPEHKTTQSKSYILLDPIYTTIVSDNRAAGMLMIGAGLDVPDEALREEVDRSLPVLRDAYVRNLMTFTANVVRTDEQPDGDLGQQDPGHSQVTPRVVTRAPGLGSNLKTSRLGKNWP